MDATAFARSLEPGHKPSSKQLKSCDFCRIARQKCFRERQGERCTVCIKNNYMCTPSRTAEQFRYLLYGPNGLMRDPKYHEDGLRDQSETTFLHLKVAQENGSSTKPLPTDDDFAENLNNFSWSHLMFSEPSDRSLPAASKRTSVSSPADDDSWSLRTPGSDPGSATSSVKEDFAHEKWTIPSTARIKMAPTSNFQPSAVPTSPTVVKSSEAPLEELRTVELFAELDAYSIMSRYFASHLRLLNMQLLDASRVCHALRAVKDAVDREKHRLLVKLELALTTKLDHTETGERLWAFNRLSSKINDYDLNSHRQVTLLMKARQLYREKGLFLEAESVLEKASPLMGSQTSSSSHTDFFEIYARSVGETCTAAADAYQRLPDWKLPEGLHSTPFTSLHRGVQDFLLVAAILNSKEYKELPLDIVGQTPIHTAAAAGNLEALILLLRHFPDIDIDHRDFLGRTPLYVATSSNQLETSRFLLEKKADPGARSVARHTMMEICAGNGFLDVTKLLYESGAPVHPFQFDNTSSPLQAAAEFGHLFVAEFLVSTGQCKVDFRRLEDGMTARDLAEKNGYQGVVKLLSIDS